MIYDVKIFTPEGDLKETIESKDVVHDMWHSRGFPTKSFQEMTTKEKEELKAKEDATKRKCKYCPELFEPRFDTSVVCRSKLCKQRYYRELGKAPLIDKICPSCLKPFKGNERSLYCLNPCRWNHKNGRKNK
jgi:hypothetical protein